MAAIFIPSPLLEPIVAAEVALEVALAAEGVAALGKSYAPVDTGRYLASIHTESSIEDGKVISQVVADVPYAIYVEFGGGNNPGEAPLRRAADSFRL